MAIRLGVGENIKSSVAFHWTSFTLVGLWAFVVTLAIAAELFYATEHRLIFTIVLLIAGFAPLLVEVIKYNSTVFAVTDHRVYVEEGVLSKTKIDIPLSKINDLEIKQSLLQRMFGSADVFILTGNSQPCRMRNIANVDGFREAIASTIAKRQTAF